MGGRAGGHHEGSPDPAAPGRRPAPSLGAPVGAVVGLLVGLLGGLLVSPGPVSAASTASKPQLAQARHALLVLSDMPSGWVTAKNTNSNSDVGNAQLARCIGVAESLISENPPSVNSPQFQNRDATLTVDDNVTVFPSTKNAAAELAIARNAKTPACMTQIASGPLKPKLFGKLPKGVTIGTPLVSPTASSAFGPGTAGYSLSVPVTTHGETLNLTTTQLYAVKGRLGQQVTFTSVGTPFSIPQEQRIMTAAVGRL
jgi:hypothetical protein